MESRVLTRKAKTTKLTLNIMKDFSLIANNIYEALQEIKIDYNNFFNANATKSIEEYIKNFKDNYNQIIKICYGKKEKSLIDYTFDSSELKKDFFVKNDSEINEKYFKKLLPYANKIFELEDEVSSVVKLIWKNELTDIKDYSPDKPYKLLVKVIGDWRDSIEKPIVKEYMESRLASSYSLISDQITKKFNLTNSDIGVICSINDGFLASMEQDAYLEEKVFGYNPLNKETNATNCIYKDNKHEVITVTPATKISTPKAILDGTVDYNEVIVNTKKAKPVAAFYYSYGQKFLSKDYDKAKKYAKDNNLALKEIPFINMKKPLSDEILTKYNLNPNKPISTKTKLKVLLKEAGSTYGVHTSVYFTNSIINLYVKPEYQGKVSFKDAFNVAVRVIEKNPQTKKELNNVIAGYLKENILIQKYISHYYIPEVQKQLIKKTVSFKDSIKSQIKSSETKNFSL